MSFYVHRQANEKDVPTVTVDHAESREHAAVKASEYRNGDPTAIYYVSNHPSKGWNPG